MNIFSNIGITELIFILILALLVVGPERLPELARSLAKGLRDLRRIYENATKDLGPELMSIQKTTQELRESVEAVRSIPRDIAQTVVKAADLEETTQDLKALTQDIGQMGQTIRNPIGATLNATRDALRPVAPDAGRGAIEATVDGMPETLPPGMPVPATPEPGTPPGEVTDWRPPDTLVAEDAGSSGSSPVEEPPHE